MAGILASDYWLIKKRAMDVPALYDPYGRYRYWHGINLWGLAAFLIAVAPNLPGLAYSINPSATFISQGAINMYTFDWLYGFVSSIVVYTVLHKLFPRKESLIEKTIDGVELLEEANPGAGSGDDEKNVGMVSEIGKGGGKDEGVGFANVDPVHRAPDVHV